jgi:hypothetical protein
MPRLLRRFWLPAVAIASILPVAAAHAAPTRTAHADRLPVLADGDEHAKVRPTTIGYTGDGSGIIGRLPGDTFHGVVGQRPGFLHWTLWTNTQAAATGTLWLLSCQPSCAASSFRRYALTLTAGRVRHGHFTRMTLHYRYQGRTVSDTRCVSDRPPALVWGLVFRGRCE